MTSKVSYQTLWLLSLSAAGMISLSLWLCHAVECQMLFVSKSHLFHFTNRDLGARRWSENLLVQSGRESTLPPPQTSPVLLLSPI